MEMEHINEDTIRVLIKSEDLAARGITFLDLLGNHQEVENFFYSILEEVDVENEFKGSEAVTFQVMPSGDGLELYISKNVSLDNMENIDPYQAYSNFYSPEEITNWLKKEDPESYEGFSQDELMNWFKEKMPAKTEKTEKVAQKPEPMTRDFVFEFASFEFLIQLAAQLPTEELVSHLYAMNNQYYLAVQFVGEYLSDEQIENQVAVFSEFARKSHLTPEVLAEHGQLIMENDAIGQTRRYFKA